MCRLDSGPRVLDHQAFFSQNRIALAQHKADPPKRRDKPVRLWLPALHILGRDNIEKQIADFRAPKNRLRLDPQSTGRDHQWKPPRAITNKLLRARIQDLALGKHLLVNNALARSKFRDKRLVRMITMRCQYRGETIMIVESNQPRIVIVARDL